MCKFFAAAEKEAAKKEAEQKKTAGKEVAERETATEAAQKNNPGKPMSAENFPSS